ncbi:MAG: hypothetical protein FPO08_00150 [Geobacter sp.]|nr:MAG: hypothetical protein FPO08_00150 [Geobacter sp.]
MAKLVNFNAQARERLNAANTASLHDFRLPREQMATASEIGGCERRVVEDLKNPPVHNDRQRMVFERGHVYELMVEQYLDAMGFKRVTPEEFATAPGPCYVGGRNNQLTIEHPELPIGAHADFVIKHKTGALFVIECKTTDGIPSDPYGSWIEQLHTVMGLLQIHNPNVEIRGSVLARDLNKGHEHEFDGYAFNKGVFDYLTQKGIHLSLAKQGKVDPIPNPGPLCGFCNHREGCPGHAGAVKIPANILDIAEQVDRLNSSKKEIEKDIDTLKGQLLEFTGTRYRGEEDGICLTATTVPDSETDYVDPEKLKADFPEAFAACASKKKRAGYTKVEVKPIKLKAPKAPKAAKKQAETTEAVAA